jgi:Potential Queuosine, Q, salvage protein family
VFFSRTDVDEADGTGWAGIEITSPAYWHSAEFTEDVLRGVFRSATDEEMPLLPERFRFMKEAAEVLCREFDLSIANLIDSADGSAARLVNTLGDRFACFRDEARFEKRTVRFMKRAQIFAADLWAAFDGESFGAFNDIDTITMFAGTSLPMPISSLLTTADYRVPQMLRALGALTYSPPLGDAIKRLEPIPSGSSWEVQIRGCAIWCVELMRREIRRMDPRANVNAVLIDFFLYDSAKELIEPGDEAEMPHHRTRSVWY